MTEALHGAGVSHPRSLAWRRAGWRLAALLVVLAGWLLASATIGAQSLPGPWAVLQALLAQLVAPQFWVATGQTVLSTILGLAVASIIAIPTGLAIGASRFASASTRIMLDFLASIPPVSFLPLALLLFGPSLPMKLVLIGYGCCWPLLIRTIDALRDIDGVQHDVCTAFGLRASTRWRRVYIPAAMPGILVGLRTASTISLLLSIVAEYIGGADGLGATLTKAQQDGNADIVLAIAVVTAVLGVLLNLGMQAVERAAIPWHPSVRGTGR
ncbi:ABC transporter permease [Agromyces subbeticus]|uniref:ABC transporter permease n=1 Tax=Agromyces subbeticus TaxID=293890 RepID=UPI0003B448AE|nr:ABC transporter permease [Agromyces subbeticus]